VSVPRHRPLLAVPAAAVVALIASGCSHGEQATANPSPSPTTASPSPTPDRVAIARQDIVSAYRATFADMNEAVERSNRNDRALDRHAIRGARIQLVQAVDFYLREGVVPRGLPEMKITFKSLSLSSDPPLATLQTCVNSSRVPLVDGKTGKPAKGFFDRPTVDTALMTIWRGRWMVEAFKFGKTRCT
jgi:hypothetical protein